MRVLFLSPTLPWPLDAGGRIRTYQLLRGVREEHEVHLWAVRQPEAGPECEERVKAVCAELRVFERSTMPVPRHWIAPAPESWFHSAPLEAALAEAYASSEYDLVHVDEMCLARPLLELSGTPDLLHHHKLDVELTRGLHLAGRATLVETMRWRALEEQAAARFPRQLFCSEEDAQTFTARHPGVTSHVVPNGVDLEYFTPLDVDRDPRELLFLGSLDYAPNQDGLEQFLTLVWPGIRKAEPEASLVVVGRAPAEELRQSPPPGVHVIPDVEDVRPYLARAAALVVPLRIGGGSRLKIAEALAMGCPVFSTEIGAEGLGLVANVHLGIVPEVAELSSPLLEHLQDSRAATERAAQAGAHARESLDWSRSALALSEAWSRFAERSGSMTQPRE